MRHAATRFVFLRRAQRALPAGPDVFHQPPGPPLRQRRVRLRAQRQSVGELRQDCQVKLVSHQLSARRHRVCAGPLHARRTRCRRQGLPPHLHQAKVATRPGQAAPGLELQPF